MSDSVKKYSEDSHIYYFDEGAPYKRINNTLTLNSCIDIINRLSLSCNNERLLEEVEELKNYLRSKL